MVPYSPEGFLSVTSSFVNYLGGSRKTPTESFELMDKAKANSKGKTWKREDLHRA
jgi:hypothetical protein